MTANLKNAEDSIDTLNVQSVPVQTVQLALKSSSSSPKTAC